LRKNSCHRPYNIYQLVWYQPILAKKTQIVVLEQNKEKGD